MPGQALRKAEKSRPCAYD